MSQNRFDIQSFESRLEAKNRFDGNLRFGAGDFHTQTNRTGAGRPSSGKMVREMTKVVEDTGSDRYARKDGFWEPVSSCPVCGSAERDFMLTRFGLNIYRCGHCTHRYLNPRLKFEAVEQL